MMTQLLQSGLLVDIVIAITLLECVALLVYRRATGRGISAAALLSNLAAGIFLLVALRAAIGAASWFWIALALAAAGIAHCIDLRERWR